MKPALVAALLVAVVACAPTKQAHDSRKTSHSFVRSYMDDQQKPPVLVLLNDHPSAAIRVRYEATEPGGRPKRGTALVKAFKTVPVGSAGSKVEIIGTDFDDPWYRGE